MFHPDGGLVTLDIRGMVSKYKSDINQKPSLLWRCQTVAKAHALAVDKKTGLVYVTCTGQTLYIIDEGG